MTAPVAAVDWPDRLFATLKRADIRQVGYVPDAGHARLIDRCRADPDIRDVVLTTPRRRVWHWRRPRGWAVSVPCC